MNNRANSFMTSETGTLLRTELEKMAKSKLYNTKSIYSAFDKDGLTFVDRNMRYMSQYPNLNYEQYISNLKLKTKIG